MFRPIKNLLTYIQKNASGTSIFGGTTETVELTETVDTSTIATTTASTTITTTTITTKIARTQQKIDKEKVAAIAESAELIESVTKDKTAEGELKEKEVEKQEEGEVENLLEANMMNGNKSKIMNSGAVVVKEKLKPAAKTDAQSFNGEIAADVDDIDDIEAQIKSSVMLRKPLNHYNKAAASNKRNHDRANTVVVVDDEVEISKSYSVEPGNGEDFCSIASSDEGGIAVVEDVEVLVTDDEGGEADEKVVLNDDAPFIDLTPEFDEFPNNELIILNEPDLNNSINSDAISEDPLAIDEFVEGNAAPADEAINPLLSHNSTSSDILWISIDEIKTSAIASDVDKDVCSDATPPITPTATPNKVANRACKATALRVLNKSLNDEDEELNPEELRSEGSDSGLGSETSTLQSTLNSVADTSQNNITPTHKEASFASTTVDGQFEGGKVLPRKPADAASMNKQPLRSNLKRRLIEVEDDSPLDAHTTLSEVSSLHLPGGAQKKTRRSINFDNVQVFYFPRQQGFGCVPSAGGCTLGMGAQHISFKTLTLAEHAAELRRAHRQQLQEVSPRCTIGTSSSEDSEESEEDYLSEDSSDADGESSGFLQPVSPKQRRALLKAAGVRKIDASEKVECRDIRNSREVCGCTCRDFCDPETCACSQAGIKCQVDRAMFPCGCSRDACGNTVGRVEFNPSRVRTHFIHTIMRLEMESRHQQKPTAAPTPHHTTNLGYVVPLPDSAASVTSTALNQMGSNYYSMQQTQSNYSSGYASPAYPPIEQTAAPGYFQAQSHQTHYAEIVEPDAAIIQETSAYQVDSCLEASLFAGAGVSATPSYSELIPSYGDVCTVAGVAASPTSQTTNYHATSLSYGAISNCETTVETVSSLAFTSYNHAASSSTNYLNMNPTTNSSGVSNFSSCSVPSAPPFGAATTTAASATHYHESVLETTTAATLTPSNNNCSTTDGPASFISLNSPISSSSRLSAINNLLQHNRNTTAALVAVSHTTTTTAAEAAVTALCATNLAATAELNQSLNSCSVNASSVASHSLDSNSLDTSPIDSIGSKSCINFVEDIAASSLLPTPLAAVLNLGENQQIVEELKSDKAAIIVNKESTAPSNLTDVLTTPTSPLPEVAISTLAAT